MSYIVWIQIWLHIILHKEFHLNTKYYKSSEVEYKNCIVIEMWSIIVSTYDCGLLQPFVFIFWILLINTLNKESVTKTCPAY